MSAKNICPPFLRTLGIACTAAICGSACESTTGSSRPHDKGRYTNHSLYDRYPHMYHSHWPYWHSRSYDRIDTIDAIDTIDTVDTIDTIDMIDIDY